MTASGTTVTPEEFANAWRVLILHHHVVSLDTARSTGSRIRQWFTRHTTVLKGADKLASLLKDRIDIILHGHEHLPVAFQEETLNAIIVSAGTASEWTGDPYANSFYLLTFFDDRSIEVEEHVWNGTGFTTFSRDGERLVQRLAVPRFQGLATRTA